MTVSIRRMTLGSGYKYLMGSVAQSDGASQHASALTRYYAESGTPPGRFIGQGLAGLGYGVGVEPGTQVTEEHLFRMLGMVQDPLTGEQLGRPPCAQRAPYAERVRTRISAETVGLKGTERDAQVLKIKSGERTAEAKIARAVAGFDLTFSAPKSVSVAWALADGGTQAVIYEAHQLALAYVLRYAEQCVFTSRSGKNGVVQEEIRGVVGAAFDHWDSRAGDPQLHDHPDDDSSNQWVISTEVTFRQGRVEKRFDLVLWCNGFPLVVGEAKSATRPAYTWIDGAAQVHDDYEQSVPQFFVPNVLSFATEGKDLRYGTVGMPVELWGPWREETTDEDAPAKIGLVAVQEAAEGVLKPAAVLEFLRFFTIFADHFRAKVEPEGFKAQVVAYDKASCVAYKEELDKYLGSDASTIVMSKSRGDSPDWARWSPDAEGLEQVVARFNDPADPLKIIIVTAKLLTGFDAPILYCQYLDRPLKEHTLLQAITRTNRVYPPKKTHGLIVDYLGVFDDVAKSLSFDEKSVQQVISNIEELKKQLAPAIAAALAFFPGVDRTVGGYQGLVQAQSAIADDVAKDAFGLGYSIVSQLWEALSPDPMLAPYRDDYRWLTDVYQSVRPSDIAGRLVWHALGAKTIDLINEHVQVEIPQSSETIVLDAQTIEDLMLGKKADGPIEDIEKQITARIARHLNNPVFVELGKRLNALREKYADIQQSSLDFLRELLELARDTVAAEKAVNEVPREVQGKAALTELFEALKTDETPIIVDNIVNQIDEVVRGVRFEGWQSTIRGDQEVRQVLRKTLYVQFKIRDNDVFEKALGYVREYY